jgi:hypothetical protein
MPDVLSGFLGIPVIGEDAARLALKRVCERVDDGLDAQPPWLKF